MRGCTLSPLAKPGLDFGRLKLDHVSCNSGEKQVVTPISQRVRKHREALRDAGMRPVQLWVPDTRAQRVRRRVPPAVPARGPGRCGGRRVLGVLDAALEDLEGWTRVKRGDFVTIALQGDFGKPRPALVVQANQFEALATVTVLPVTSSLVDAPLMRIPVKPDAHNGLSKPSQVMADKAVTVKRDKVGPVFGSASDDLMLAVSRALAVFLGIA